VTNEHPQDRSDDDEQLEDSDLRESTNGPSSFLGKKKSAKKSSQLVSVVRREDGTWEFKEPRCANARREDMEEVQQMIDAGETEIALDELRWLLSGCQDFMAAHRVLGDLAMETGDLKLARGHYGYAYQIAMQAIDRAGGVQSLPFCSETNRTFWESARGLVQCLGKLGKPGMQRDVIQHLLAIEPSDPLQLKGLAAAKSSAKPSKKRKPKWRRK
jgi:hypothetical protein